VNADLIERLARLRGIGDAYHDYRGELRRFSVDTKAALLQAMGCTPGDAAALEAEIGRLEHARSQRLLPPLAAAHGPRIGLDINVAACDLGGTLLWSVILEDGSRREGQQPAADCPELWRGGVDAAAVTRRRFELPVDLPPGYHELRARVASGELHTCRLILSPPECHEPAAIVAGRRLWGLAVQLYTVRSRDNWGIGDFDDLRRLIRWAVRHGAGFIGLNPLHALAPADPARASPYSASNRHFLNVLYIALPAVPEFAVCEAARARLAESGFAARLAALRSASLVDYDGVAAVKMEILGLLHGEFRARHLAASTDRARSFLAFVAAGGEALQRHALFDALDRHFRATAGTASGWLNWPAEYHDVAGAAVRRFSEQHAEAVEFFLYLQWIAQEQLAGAQALTRELGMPIGLYGDYAVGANPGGSETWMDQTTYRMGAEIGAPPDPIALRGQGWGIPPPDPVVLESQRLQGFVGLLRDNMRFYGALRLDHVMALFRLWWVPAGYSPTAGAYVHYPLHQLLTVLTLESARNRCLVVGEDLGVVPDEMREAMPQYGLYHYKVLLFEKLAGRFREPGQYLRRALATVTTHDMPTLRSFWDGLDIGLRTRLKLYPNPESQAQVLVERCLDRRALLAALNAAGLAPASPAAPDEPFTAQLALALHLYLARSNAVLAAVQIEDLLGMVEPVNVPGTYLEYPNWQRKLTADIEEIEARADLSAGLAQIDTARRAAPC
jgi:4-alpha-glucanotransferase